jgi:hypothetical protein
MPRKKGRHKPLPDGRGSVSDGRGSVRDGRGSVRDGRGSVRDGRGSVSDCKLDASFLSRARQPAALPSKTYKFEDLAVRDSGENRQRIQLHQTELAPGLAPHAAHRHAHEEMIFVREGAMEATIEGVAQRGRGAGALLRAGAAWVVKRRRARADYETVRRIGLALPHVEEGTSYGTPALKVKGKLFARLREDPDSLAIRMPFDQRDELMAHDPQTYYITDHYRDYEWMLVRLSKVHPDALGELLRTAHKAASAPRAKLKRR